MKNVMYKIIVSCYIIAVIILITICNEGLDIQQAYPFTMETLSVPQKLKMEETTEICCQLMRGGVPRWRKKHSSSTTHQH